MVTAFDIVVPLGPNEFARFPTQLRFLIRNVIGFRRIYIVCNLSHPNVSLCHSEEEEDFIGIDIQWIDESIFPFSISDLLLVYPKPTRIAWYFQQLIKFYACHVLPDLLDYYLIVDADVFFLKPLSFFDESGKPMYTIGHEYHVPYFQHMAQLHPCLTRVSADKSGISHHMMFRRTWVHSLFCLVESFHQHEPFWHIFIRHVSEHRFHSDDFPDSGASEYEIFFNFLLIHCPRDITIRSLNWTNFPHDLNILQYDSSSVYDYVSVCHWL